MASAWVTMAFTAPLNVADARDMCAEHVLGVSYLCDFDESRRVVI